MANHFSYVRKNRIGIAALSILLGGLIIHAQEKQARVAPNASCR
jgi:hypothetical protein